MSGIVWTTCPKGFLLEAIRHNCAHPAFAQAAKQRAETLHAYCQALLDAEPKFGVEALDGLWQHRG